MIKVKASYFKAASLCMSNEETRYYLNGVYIEPCAVGGVTLTATDGHRLVCIHDKDGTCDKPAIVGLPKGALKSRCPDGEINVGEDGLFRHGTFISLKSVLVDGAYPDYRHVVLLTQKGGLGHKAAPAIKGRYLSDFAKIASILQGQPDDQMPVRIMTGPTDADPALVLFSATPEAFGIIMPMRAKSPPEKFAWFIAGPKKVKTTKKPEPKDEKQAA